MDYGKLIKILRETDFSDGCPCGAEPLCDGKDCVILQAADAIEQLVVKLNHADEQIVSLVDANVKFPSDNISLHMAVETRAWTMVWAAEPLRKVNVEMTYQDLWNIAKSIWGGYLPREEKT